MAHDVPISTFLISELAERRRPDSRAIMRSVCERYGFLHATLYVLRRENGVRDDTLFTTYSPEWVNRYFVRDYGRLDSIMRRSRRSVLPVNWCAVKPESCTELRIIGEAVEHGVGSAGLTVAQRGPSGEVSFLTFTSDERSRHWNRRVKEIVADTIYAACILTDALKPDVEHKGKTQTLTKREQEILQWASCGKTAWETGRILGISQRTVEFHIENSRRKLNTATKMQTVTKALSHRLIDA